MVSSHDSIAFPVTELVTIMGKELTAFLKMSTENGASTTLILDTVTMALSFPWKSSLIKHAILSTPIQHAYRIG